MDVNSFVQIKEVKKSIQDNWMKHDRIKVVDKDTLEVKFLYENEENGVAL